MDPDAIGNRLVCTECKASEGFFEVYVRQGSGGSGTYLTFICTNCGHHEMMDFDGCAYDGG